jgi:RNA polymerase sigma-70 factor (ECF subfamily)
MKKNFSADAIKQVFRALLRMKGQQAMILLLMLQQEYGVDTKSTVIDGDILDIARGEPDAVRRLYEKTHKGLYGFILSITRNPHDAEDALQDTFLAIYRYAGDYKPKGKPLAWLYTVAKNAARMKLRAKGDHLSLEEELHESEAFARIEDTEERLTLEAALTLLSEEERQIVLLHAVSGLKNREIATLLELPLNTVLSKYHRALKKLKSHIEGETSR